MSFAESKDSISEGDTVILYISVNQVYALEVTPKITNKHGQLIDNVFQTKYGSLKVTDLIGMKFGSRVHLSKGWAHVLYPTPEMWTITLPHRTQILYTPDISMVLTQLEVGPGSVVCEAGTGSGSLSHALLRAIGPTGKLHTCDFHKERVQMALDEFRKHGFGDRVTVTHRDVCIQGLGVKEEADAVFLDLPKPWEALPHGITAIKASGGRICSFSPCIEQISRTCELMQELGLKDITTLECLAREFQVKTISLPVIGKMKKRAEVLESDSNQDESSANKKQKVSNSTEDNDGEAEGDKDGDQKNGVQKNEDIKFRTGVAQLKMPGHTGFLTFATVPPGLSRCNLVMACSN